MHSTHCTRSLFLETSLSLQCSEAISRATWVFPAAVGVSGGFLPLRRPLRRREGGESPDLRSGVVNRGLEGGVGVAGSPASSFWCAAASPLRRRRRRRCQVAGESPLCRCFLRRQRRIGGECGAGRRRRCETAVAGVCGVLVVDPAISVEVEWRWPRIRAGRCSGRVPGRRFFFVSRSSSRELVDDAVHQRLWTRSSSDPGMRTPGGRCLRRLRRWRPCVLEDLDGEDGVLQQRRSLYPSLVFFACIRLCNLPFYL